MKKLVLILVLLTGILGFASAGFCADEALIVDENGNVGIGVTEPQAKLHVKGDLVTQKKLTVIEHVFDFDNPENGYPVGEEWEQRYYHIRTPIKHRSYLLYRYDLKGYSYSAQIPIEFTWVGYTYTDGPFRSNAKDTAGNNIPVSQYIGGDGYLYLKFGPISQFKNTFKLDVMFKKEVASVDHDHDRNVYKVFLTADSNHTF